MSVLQSDQNVFMIHGVIVVIRGFYTLSSLNYVSFQMDSQRTTKGTGRSFTVKALPKLNVQRQMNFIVCSFLDLSVRQSTSAVMEPVLPVRVCFQRVASYMSTNRREVGVHLQYLRYTKVVLKINLDLIFANFLEVSNDN